MYICLGNFFFFFFFSSRRRHTRLQGDWSSDVCSSDLYRFPKHAYNQDMTRDLIQKIHTYAGLLTFVNLMVFGIVGLSATLGSRPQDLAPVVRSVPFVVEPNLT